MAQTRCETPPSQGEVPTGAPALPNGLRHLLPPSTGQTKALPAQQPPGEHEQFHRFHRCSTSGAGGAARSKGVAAARIILRSPRATRPPPSPESPLAVLPPRQRSAAAAVSRRVAVATRDPAPRGAPACRRQQRRSHEVGDPTGASSSPENWAGIPGRDTDPRAGTAAAAQTTRDPSGVLRCHHLPQSRPRMVAAQPCVTQPRCGGTSAPFCHGL